MQEQKLIKRKKKATNDANKSLLASTCIDLAELYCQEDRYIDAIDEYTIVADCYKQMGKHLDFGRANRMIGEAYMHLREFDKALNYHQIYLHVAREQNDKLEEQRALATIGHTHLSNYLDNTDNPNKTALNLAYKFFMKSLIVCESLTNVSKYEHKDMMARLLANLGVVHECQREYDKSVELVQKSIAICKSYDLYEQLERDYSFLGSLYLHKGEYNNAINQYNLAIEVAKRLKNRVPLMCASLIGKADILIKLSDFHSAKTVLFKAYKLRHPNTCERETIEHNLKLAMCNAEDSLLMTSNLDYKTRKRLYEKLGDGACNLKSYENAIEYYQKMLEAAQNNGESGSDLSPCYISLAETYRDNKQYDLAIKYFQKDYDLFNENVKEKVGTLLNIADCMEAAKKDIVAIEDIYDQARNECIRAEEKRLQAKVLVRHIAFLRANGRLSQAASLEQEIETINHSSVESESELSEEQATPDISDDISISNITDDSDDSIEDANSSTTRVMRKRKKGMTVKRNNKGETQLHTACISGNVELVKRLLDQGHPVNVRDNCGWLPIHEACICGHLDIVKMLIEKGALINDRGGTLCNGMTPLHDAASNGHLEVIQLLLDKGASAISRNDMGETPFHILKKLKSSNSIDFEDEGLYNSLVIRFTESMEKLGHSTDTITSKNVTNPALVTGDDLASKSRQKSYKLRRNSKENIIEKSNKNQKSSLRRNVSFDEDLDASTSRTSSRVRDSSSSSSLSDHEALILDSKKEATATDEYKRIMENLRHPLRDDNTNKKRKSNESARKSAYLEPNEVGDDWLEDDLSLNFSKKRKTTSTSTLINTTGTKRHSVGSLNRHNSSSSIKSRSSMNNDEFDIPNEFYDLDFHTNDTDMENINKAIINVEDSDDEFKSFTSKGSIKKRKHQSSLIEQGFTRTHSSSPVNSLSSISNSNLGFSRQQQTKLTNFGSTTTINTEPDLLTSQFSNSGMNLILTSEPTLSVDVRIDGKLYRVPVVASELNVRTIKWLAEEAAQRYSRKECIKPTLELETKNGAVLADDDYISILFIAGSVQAEEVTARIIKWNLPSLSQRYYEACCQINTTSREDVTRILQETSSFLNLSDAGLTNKYLIPICKAINKQVALYHINLSGNSMLEESIQTLCSSLPSLNNLVILNISSNNLNSKCLEIFANMFTEASNNILENLISLDLSYNPLGDESLRYLAIITRYLKLQTLNLKSVDFTCKIFDNNLGNQNVDLCLDYITNFDISYNKLGKQEILLFLSWIKPKIIENLNISNNIDNEKGLLKDVINWLNCNDDDENNITMRLKSLNLSRCNVSDAEAYELERIFLLTDAIRELNLSYNTNLSHLSLRAISQVNDLNVIGCENLLKETSGNFEDVFDCTKLRQIRISYGSREEKDVIICAWKNKYKEKAEVVQDIKGLLHLSLNE